MKAFLQSPGFDSFKRISVICLTIVALMTVGIGFYNVLHSPLFTVRVVEVSDLPENSPVDAQAITDLAAVPVDVTNLFDLDLHRIETRMLTHPWVREVLISKRFPQTVSITVVFRDPKALIQKPNGDLSYVDSNGMIFSKVNLMSQPDLPVLTGISKNHEVAKTQVLKALQFLAAWDKSKLERVSQISSLSYDTERGFRALVTYPLGRGRGQGRTMVHLGQEIDADFENMADRLRHVFAYLIDNGISAKQVWADLGKKVVVKIARSS
ncbi:MAG: FtsQ-type POTRA domain-containing protein [Methylotenera sp.]|nr:FtsQ-type POTRA domain-containing protein [Oligoflexia bacterium]